MLSRVRLIRVFVASPGDITQEREALAGVIAELNRTVARMQNARLELVRWETDVRPGFGIDAQDVINRQLPPIEIFVGLFWNRLGTPTHRARSGTVEEFERAYASFKQRGVPHILMYFREPNGGTSGELEPQAEQVKAFRQSLAELGALYRTYDDAAAFTSLVREHLANELPSLLDHAGRSKENDAPPLPDDVDAELCGFDAACRNLVRMADDLNPYSDHHLAQAPETVAEFRRLLPTERHRANSS